VGYVPADAATFYPRLTGRQNLEFFAALAGVPRPRCRIEAVLEQVGLHGRGGVRVQEYSTGMKQRLALARALLPEPSVLLLDEPTRSLDPEGRRDVVAILRAFILERDERSVLLVTHSIDEARDLCDRRVVLADGRTSEARDPRDLRERLRSLSGHEAAADARVSRR
jgi:ABC-2 type transport system ATP-binding protein